jgi:hypothetical protein
MCRQIKKKRLVFSPKGKERQPYFDPWQLSLQDFFQDRHQIFKTARLSIKLARPEVFDLGYRGGIGRSRQDYHRDFTELFILIDLGQKLLPVHQGHVQVKKNKVSFEFSFYDLAQSFAGTIQDSAADRLSGTFQGGQEDFLIIFIIVDEENILIGH